MELNIRGKCQVGSRSFVKVGSPVREIDPQPEAEQINIFIVIISGRHTHSFKVAGQSKKKKKK